jgi:hypothetical protein
MCASHFRMGDEVDGATVLAKSLKDQVNIH